MKANLFGFGKRGKIWAKHLIELGFDLKIYDPAYPMFSELPNMSYVDLNIIASSSDKHILNIKDVVKKTDSTIIVEKPLVTTLEDLEWLITNNVSTYTAFSERFKHVVQFVKQLHLYPVKIQCVMGSEVHSNFFTDKLIHHLDLLEYLWGIREKPKYTSSFSLSNYFPTDDVTYVRSFDHPLISMIIFSTINDYYIMDLKNNKLRMNNSDEIDFGNQDTIPQMIDDVIKLRHLPVRDYFINSPTQRAIEMMYEN